MASSKMQHPRTEVGGLPPLSRFKLKNISCPKIDNLIPKAKTTTFFKRVLCSELYKRVETETLTSPGGPIACEKCARDPSFKLLCCGERMCRDCGVSPEHLLATHPCFLSEGWPRCAACDERQLDVIETTACCGVCLCQGHMGEWYDEIKLANSCPRCGTIHPPRDIRRKFTHQCFIRTEPPEPIEGAPSRDKQGAISRIKRHLRDKRYLSSEILDELVSRGFSGMSLLELLGSVHSGSMLEASPMPVVPAQLLSLQTYDFGALKLNLEDPDLPRCPNGTCAGKRWNLPVLMPLGYKTSGANPAGSEHGCLACVIRTQEIYSMRLVVEAVARIDPPKTSFFVFSVTFDSDVNMTPIPIKINNSVFEFKGMIGCYAPSRYYRLAELASRLKLGEGGRVDASGLRLPMAPTK